MSTGACQAFVGLSARPVRSVCASHRAEKSSNPRTYSYTRCTIMRWKRFALIRMRYNPLPRYTVWPSYISGNCDMYSAGATFESQSQSRLVLLVCLLFISPTTAGSLELQNLCSSLSRCNISTNYSPYNITSRLENPPLSKHRPVSKCLHRYFRVKYFSHWICIAFRSCVSRNSEVCSYWGWFRTLFTALTIDLRHSHFKQSVHVNKTNE